MVFKDNFKNSIGYLEINEWTTPFVRGVFDPLAKLWASLKKKLYVEYGVSVCATFYYSGDTAKCTFLRNSADETVSNKLAEERFESTFKSWVVDFEILINAFMADNCHKSYKAILADSDMSASEKEEACERIFNKFLEDINLRPGDHMAKDEDLVKKAREERKAAKKRAKEEARNRKTIKNPLL